MVSDGPDCSREEEEVADTAAGGSTGSQDCAVESIEEEDTRSYSIGFDNGNACSDLVKKQGAPSGSR